MKNKAVLITGGGKGIGRETARAFLEAGFSVAITGRSVEALNRTAEEFKAIWPEILAIAADVSLEEDCRRTVSTVMQEFGRLDVLINNAGMSARGTFDETEVSLYRNLIGINFLGPVMMSRFSLDEIRRQRGSIVYISTLAGMKGLPGLSHYSSSKMPLTGFSDSIREELRSDGVHVGIIYVGFTDNDPGKTIYDAKGERILLNREKNSMTRRQVAQAVLRSVRKRRDVTVLSSVGKLASFAYRYFPKVSGFILSRATMKSGMYRAGN